jgi:hypothetical protein
MTEYLLTIYTPADAAPPPPEALGKIMRNVNALTEEAKAAGVWVFNGGLHAPSTATVLKAKDGEVLVTDGPYLEGKEYVGGLTIVDVPDLDAALEWGRKYAEVITGLAIEVRPFVDESGH